MMLGAEVETLTTGRHNGGSAVDDHHGPCRSVQVSVIVQLSEAAVDEVNMVLIGEDASAGDRAATASELVNLTAGRLHAHAGDKEVKSVCSLPETKRLAPSSRSRAPAGQRPHHAVPHVPGGKAPFAVTLKIEHSSPSHSRAGLHRTNPKPVRGAAQFHPLSAQGCRSGRFPGNVAVPG